MKSEFSIASYPLAVNGSMNMILLWSGFLFLGVVKPITDEKCNLVIRKVAMLRINASEEEYLFKNEHNKQEKVLEA